ncbi:phosphatidylserine decarboxylase [Neoconidiobolus thromboides FSU 785]|nr:phosphatidylserine decarboxylase [Neoconidiobolus thromboides FSU 785]
MKILAKAKKAWKSTPIDWTPLPIGVGIAFVAFYSFWKKRRDNNDEEQTNTPKGPWQLQVYTSLPLKTLSRMFGLFNEINLPVWLRDPSLRLYSWVFGCNLNEMEDQNLKNYPNLSTFFFRKLKPGVRPLDDAILISPADGRVLHFGEVTGNNIEQIKGISYDINDLLGRDTTSSIIQETMPVNYKGEVINEEEFANVNGINYSLAGLFGGESNTTEHPHDENEIKKERVDKKPWESISNGRKLFFTVIYLAPGDYHRFHSPTNWVVELRRHFAGELYSVSPFILKYLQNLFVLNERVALIGKWKHGFFSMLPVGATNVGSIKIHFDEDLKTNERKITHRGTYTQVSYSKASPLLKGYPLNSGQEIGGFCLGSTIVLVFEAPENFEFKIENNQKIKVGQTIGDLPKLPELKE